MARATGPCKEERGLLECFTCGQDIEFIAAGMEWDALSLFILSSLHSLYTSDSLYYNAILYTLPPSPLGFRGSDDIAETCDLSHRPSMDKVR